MCSMLFVLFQSVESFVRLEGSEEALQDLGEDLQANAWKSEAFRLGHVWLSSASSP